jgi:hypothetical protein
LSESDDCCWTSEERAVVALGAGSGRPLSVPGWALQVFTNRRGDMKSNIGRTVEYLKCVKLTQLDEFSIYTALLTVMHM